MIEQWKQVIGYEGKYEVSNLGNVRNSRLLLMKPIITKQGYVRIGFRNPEKKMFNVHRLVGFAFILNPENKPFINHIDGNKLNNNVLNLEWVTQSENELHAHRLGLKPKPEYWKNKFGVNHGSSIKVSQYTMDNVFIAKFDSISDAANTLNINGGCIGQVCIGKYKSAGGYIWKYNL